jgi:hypothetical protein
MAALDSGARCCRPSSPCDSGCVGLARTGVTNEGGPDVRVLMKVQIPTAAGNDAIKDGSLPEIVGKALEALNAEAAYFRGSGHRCGHGESRIAGLSRAFGG